MANNKKHALAKSKKVDHEATNKVTRSKKDDFIKVEHHSQDKSSYQKSHNTLNAFMTSPLANSANNDSNTQSFSNKDNLSSIKPTKDTNNDNEKSDNKTLSQDLSYQDPLDKISDKDQEKDSNKILNKIAKSTNNKDINSKDHGAQSSFQEDSKKNKDDYQLSISPNGQNLNNKALAQAIDSNDHDFTSKLQDNLEHNKEDKQASNSSKGKAILIKRHKPQDKVEQNDHSQNNNKAIKERFKKSLRLRNIFLILALLIALFIGGIYGLMHVYAPDLSRFYDRSQSLYDKNGNLIYSSLNKDGFHRILTTQAQVDPLYIKMLIASEDERFYSHPGVDIIAIGRALWSNLTSGAIVSGASTIAMQVCRMLEPKDRSLGSKIKEALGALYLTQYYGRDQILSMYLTLAPFGGNIEGVNAASYIYFNQSPKNLTPAQAALLVALPRSPEIIRPDRHPKSARYYRNEVLKKAVVDKIIKSDILTFATEEPIVSKRHELPKDAYYLGQSIFTSKLITPEIKALRELTAKLIENKVNTNSDKLTQDHSANKIAHKESNTINYQEQHDTIKQVIEVQLSGASIRSDQFEAFNKVAKQDRLKNQALIVNTNKSDQVSNTNSTDDLVALLGPLPRELYTTIDSKVQSILLDVVEEYRNNFVSADKKESLGIIVINNDTFEVLGYIGALGTDLSYVDTVLSLRSPGSAIKPFAYALAFAQGLLHPNSILLDDEQIYEGYQPRNYDRKFHGQITAAKALQASLNLPAVEISRAIGPDNLVNMINSVQNDLDMYDSYYHQTSYKKGALVLPKGSEPSLSLVLGGCGISLFDLSHLYALLAHDGASSPLRVLSSKRPSSAVVRKYNFKYHLDNIEEDNKVRSLHQESNKDDYGQAVKEHTHYQQVIKAVAARATYNILEGTPAPLMFGNKYYSLGPKISYKTGTSFKHRDAWALGSSNNITVGVWSGRTDGSSSFQRTGFNHAAPILFNVLTKLTSNDSRKKRIVDDVLLHARPPLALSKVQVKKLGLVVKKSDGYKSYDGNVSLDSRQGNLANSPNNIEPLAITFPNDNSRISLGSLKQVLIKFTGGKAPYYVLVNDELNSSLDHFVPSHDGFYHITVIDSLGNSVSSQVYVQGCEP